jgi:hypothetical protein
MKCFLVFMLVLVSGVLIGCATVTRGTSQGVSISSSPSDASVTIDNWYVGKTPIIVKLTRDESHDVAIEFDGYEPYFTKIVSERDMAMAGNCLFGGCLGIGVDSWSGAAFALKPDWIHASLSKIQ